MLLLGKTPYRNTTSGGSSGESRTPKEVDLGRIGINGDYPTEAELAQAINTHPTPIIIGTDELVVFKVEYFKLT